MMKVLCFILALLSVTNGAHEEAIKRVKRGAFDCPSTDGFYPDPDDCASFFRCRNGTSHRFSCPTFLLFNPSLRICDFPELVRCGVGPTVKPHPKCSEHLKFGPGPPASCTPISDPNNKPKAPLESWFTREMFEDLFPKANIGWGPDSCLPYNYDSFIMAARYFPAFGAGNANNKYTKEQNQRRDLAAFFAHAVQETGENDANLYRISASKEAADDCFYRGGFFNWFEGGPKSSFLNPASPGFKPEDGAECNMGGVYCASSKELDYWFPCSSEKSGSKFKGCYFGRGAIQISYNYNYGQFNNWLKTVNIDADLLKEPNLVMTKRDPPLAVLASLWFYMTPQPPKPAMHDIVLGKWESGEQNKAAGYSGPIFGPTSLIINNECNGEDATEPGGGGESRRIKAFKWFTKYFGVEAGEQKTLSCGDMPVKLAMIKHNLSYQPDWATTWKEEPCKCAPAAYGGMIPYFQKGFYPEEWQATNPTNYAKCVKSAYDNPSMYGLDETTAPCLKYKSDGSTTASSSTQSSTQSSSSKSTASSSSSSSTQSSTASSSSSSSKSTTSGGGGGGDCSSDGWFADPSSCSKFYRCVHGKKHNYACPAGLNFDPKSNVCVWPSQYKCQ